MLTFLRYKLHHSSFSSSSSSSSSSSCISSSKVPPLQTLLKKGFTPTLKSINQFLIFLSQARKLNLIIHFCSQLSSNQIKGNSQTSSIFTWALLKLRRFEEAEQFMRTQMIESLNSSTNRMWDSLIRGLCIDHEDPERALLVLRDCLKSRGILPSSFTFCSLIYRFSSLGDMSKAIEVLEFMTVVKYPFDNFVCSSVMAGFCRIGKPEFAVRFFENVTSSGALQPNVVMYTALVEALCKMGKVNEVCDLVYRLEKEGVEFDAVFYSSWICGFISEGVLLEVFQKSKQMVEKGIIPDTVSYTVLIDGFSKLGDVEKAIGFLEKMRSGGLQPNLITFTAIMLGFCMKGKLEEAFDVLKIVNDLGIKADEFMYATLINGTCKKGDFDRVFHLLNEMEKRGISPSIITYNTLINGLCKFGRTAEADDVSKSISGDSITYTTLLHAYMIEENFSGILETKKRFEEEGVCMDVVMCNVLIKALFMVGAFDDAYMVYKGMQEKDLFADSVTYCTLIQGYCKVGRIDEAVEIFYEFRSTGISSVACYNCLISELCNRGIVDMATEVFIELNEKSLALDVGICTMLIKEIIEGNRAEKISNLLYRMENMGSDMYDILCDTVISFLSKRCYPEAALEVFTIMKRKGLTLTRKSYYLLIKGLLAVGNKEISLTLLNSFLKEYGVGEPRLNNVLAHYLCLKDVDIALSFLEKTKDNSATITLPHILFKELIKDGRVLDLYQLIMEAENNLPAVDIFDYTYVLDNLCREGHISEALDLFGFAKRKGINLNIVSYNSVIGALCCQGCLVEAFRLFDSLERIDLFPSEVTYAILIGALCREGFLQDAMQLFKRMVLMGFEPNIRVYNSVIHGYCKTGQIEEALKLLDDFETKGLKPNGFTVSALIHGYCHNGDMEGALEYLSEFKKKGVLPDFLGFVYLIRGLCAKGRMEETRSIIREMLQTQSVIELINKVDTEEETESVESMLIYLCEQGSIEEALTLLNEVVTILFPPQMCSSYFSESPIQQPHYERDGSALSESKTVPERNDLLFGSFSTKGKRRVKDHDKLGRSQFHDFDYYYSKIASLCTKGELQKASNLAKEILAK
ncbi:pentatricopeptide repeat-containing protein At5g57250, mitochondrial [Humulus lupulus]|uniref:pentatricopeptide repeat-containing protein At5g57250, mitochondrial n=1 Tax=Humulus lupulus TaxID=3486 RepID=UPI002B40E94A|nr:pentatricopeptide repeat-containing protein At5g57250, mitochondrial [Humulus lupulus]XP_062077431.1 pentatricopeptide repeat-containing protein At5g57250, mitochondrial [Humulus lupulus]XP_062077432.1 pentatricopeptide repeat-containing protein At5g57250, mitochondrial [Humulus lupulus]XP_062077433.1 pentatricopeptide repeat-containing protein At5g57250, mitochondrial [Humulus lupulus]XP_062077434.1 pentatricopeptide repeat-containing protein At5g57250, mitochondrial [Humulus lupulus]XP_06